MDNLKKQRFAWYIYDWANSAYSTIIITVFFGPFLNSICRKAANNEGMIDFLGFSIYSEALFGYIISISVFLQVLILPFIGVIADTYKNKKLLLGLFAYLGAFATIMMFFIQGSNYYLATILLLISNVSFGASIVIYNSFLNGIASYNERDKISSIGWAYGYLGGALILILNLILFTNYQTLNIDEGLAVRISLLSAGLWWAIFTFIPMMILKNQHHIDSENKNISNFSQLKLTLKEILTKKNTLIFLIAFLIYNDGVQAVITFAAVFGKEELKLEQSTLISAILLVQIVAFFGSLLFNFIANKTSTLKAISFSLIIWILCLIYSYQFLFTANQFFGLASVIAIVLGGTQALSRSLFSKLIPIGKEAEYFSFYEISDKGTSWMGTLLFSLSLQFTHSYRFANLSLILFFIIGFLILLKFKEE